MIILLALATVLLAVWLVLLCMVSREDWISAAIGKVVENKIAIQALHDKEKQHAKRLVPYQGLALMVMRWFITTDFSKDIHKLTLQNERLQAGDMRPLNLVVMPGYVLQRTVDTVGRGDIYKNTLSFNLELHGRKYAQAKTMLFLAQLLSYPIIGLSAILGISGVLIGTGYLSTGLAVLIFGSLLVLVVSYALYDDVADKAKKRHERISRQFPHVVSKLALLVTSGMIMDAAWQQTADSQDGDLYIEMRKTADELKNLISPEIAYGNFISHCNTKETAKLASAILQNLSKGNAEIGRLLKELAKESWLERQHLAKRDSENASAKLMIPTMLLFIAILAMIVMPIFMSMNTGM